jgi:uncharacterized paraquat-inducible protein A
MYFVNPAMPPLVVQATVDEEATANDKVAVPLALLCKLYVPVTDRLQTLVALVLTSVFVNVPAVIFPAPSAVIEPM